MGSLLPAEDVPLRYAQLYFFDTQNEIRNWMSAFISKETPETIDKNIVANLIQRLDQTSAMAKSFRMAKEWCCSHGDANFGLRLLSERTTTRQYNEPTVSEVSALIINDFGDGLPTRDITSPIEQIVAETYPDFTSRQGDDEYLTERAILTPRNDDADAINEQMFKKLGGAAVTYNSVDEICKASTDTIDQHDLYPVEFLNSINFQGMPPPLPYALKGSPIMLILK
ncbi:ATP-dependent DNA helicase PIF1-like protein [Tanacetum coccineum]